MTTKLAPGLLVAAPSLRCPFFHHTVVLLVEHDENGALGFVINRPTKTPVVSLLDGLERKDVAAALDRTVWIGGPVAPDTGWVLFDPTSGDAGGVEAVRLSERLAVSASRAFLERLARGEGPDRYAVLLGYAGWGPEQLDDEIREGSWIAIDADPALVFDLEPADRWSAALASLGIDPACVVGATVAEA
ncbi:MAG TPA: YqgE/AlgH family protein [Sandaracinaceae bacterium]